MLHADAFVCIPITDYEVPATTLARLREHGPCVSLAPGGIRTERLWIDRDAWLPSIDILKMNLAEAGCTWFPPPGGPPEAIGRPLRAGQLPELAAHCLDRGVRAVCVTLDDEGCVLYLRGPGGGVEEHVVPPVPVEHVVDTTGCGDSFAAGLAFGYLHFGDLLTAAHYGNAMGAQRASGSDLSVYRSFAATARQVEDTYGRTPVR